MSDFIRRSAVIDALLQEFPLINMPLVQIALERLSTVDAVAVVRCKDCKFSKPAVNNDYVVCEIMECYCGLMKDDFCSFGERREENEID